MTSRFKGFFFIASLAAALFVTTSSFGRDAAICNTTSKKLEYARAEKNAENKWVSSAWYSVAADTCNKWVVNGEAYLFGRVPNENQYWTYNNNDDKSFCVNNGVDPIVDADQPCTGENRRIYTMRKLRLPQSEKSSRVFLGNNSATSLFELCNSLSEKVYFVMGFDFGVNFRSIGHYSLEPTKCMYTQVPFKNDSVYLSATTTAGLAWNGQPNYVVFLCIDTKNPFNYSDADINDCNADGQGYRSMMKVPAKEKFSFTTENASVRP